MIIKTSKGKTFDASWIFGPLRGTGELMIEMKDTRLISEIAADFEGLESIRAYQREGEPVTLYEGYARLTAVDPGTDDGSVRLTLRRP